MKIYSRNLKMPLFPNSGFLSWLLYVPYTVSVQKVKRKQVNTMKLNVCHAYIKQHSQKYANILQTWLRKFLCTNIHACEYKHTYMHIISTYMTLYFSQFLWLLLIVMQRIWKYPDSYFLYLCSISFFKKIRNSKQIASIWKLQRI